MKPNLSIIILSWNTKEYLQKCLTSLGHRLNSSDYEIIVIDNASEDGSAEMVHEHFPSVKLVVNPTNTGYAAGNNLGISMAQANHILLMNSDIEVIENAPEVMADFLDRNSSYGAVSSRMIQADGTVQRSCTKFPTLLTLLLFDIDRNRLLRQTPPVQDYLMKKSNYLISMDVEQPPAAFFMITRETATSVGLLDEQFFLFFNDVDYCKRIAKSGYRIRYLAEAMVIHHGGKSVAKEASYRTQWYIARYRYYKKWHGVAAGFLAKLVTTIVVLENGFLIIVRKMLPSRIRKKWTSRPSCREGYKLIRLIWQEK
jgi:GT2 family glycosyltransferase